MRLRRKIIIICLAVPIIISAIHFHFYSSLKNIVQAEKSINPAATNYFAHAAMFSRYSQVLHDFLFIDYDSILMKPLIKIEEKLFEKGRKDVNKGNIGEEGVWWYLIYSERYNFSRQKRKDLSVALSSLSNEKSLALRDQLYTYFLAITNNKIKGVEFGKFTSDAAHGLYSSVFNKMSGLYPREVDGRQIEEYWEDKKQFERELVFYQNYKEFIKRDPFVDEYKYVYNHMVSQLDSIIFYYWLQKDVYNVCGQLLDDYLEILSSQALDYSQLVDLRIKAIQIILNDTESMCDTKKQEIQLARDLFNERRR